MISDITNQIMSTLKYVVETDKKEFASDLKIIYHAPNEEIALGKLEVDTDKWRNNYPNAMKSWHTNWNSFKFLADVRKLIYTTNAVESLNSSY